MIVTVELKRTHAINCIVGVVQVGNQTKTTRDGKATFDVEPGVYIIRGLAKGYHFESKAVDVVGDMEVDIEAR